MRSNRRIIYKDENWECKQQNHPGYYIIKHLNCGVSEYSHNLRTYESSSESNYCSWCRNPFPKKLFFIMKLLLL